jgi:hypothetical protein
MDGRDDNGWTVGRTGRNMCVQNKELMAKTSRYEEMLASETERRVRYVGARVANEPSSTCMPTYRNLQRQEAGNDRERASPCEV